MAKISATPLIDSVALDDYAPLVRPGTPNRSMRATFRQIFAGVGYSLTRTLFFRGKRLLWGLTDPNRALTIGVAADGSVYVPNLQFCPNQLATIDARAQARIVANNIVRPVLTALDALAMAALEPVEFVPLVFDSNGWKGGSGLIGALQTGLTERFGLFSTGAACTLMNGSGNAPVWGGGTQGAAATGASAVLAALAQPRYPGGYGNVVAGNSYGYTADGASYAFPNTGGLALHDLPGVDVTKRYRAHFAYGTFASGSGSFKYQVRLLASPFTTLVSSAVISTNTGAESYQIGTIDIPADATRAGLGLQGSFCLPTGNGGQAITGPAITYFHRFECLDRSSGITVHAPIFSVASQSAWDAAVFLQALTDAELTNYLTEIRRLPVARGFKPRVVFAIDMGLNDQNETQVPSRGWKALDPTHALAAAAASSGAIATAWSDVAATQAAKSAQAYSDNILALMKRIEEVYQANKWPDDEVYWLLMPSHAAANEYAGTSMVPAYRAAAFEIGARKARCSVVDLAHLVPQAVISDLWQDSTGFHLENPFEDNGDGTRPTTNGYNVLIQNYFMPLIPVLQ